MKAILVLVLLCGLAFATEAQTPQVYGRLTDRLETGRVRNVRNDLLTFSPRPEDRTSQ
jgi:hypothetical protein